MSSAVVDVVDAIELVCAGIVHNAQGQSSPLWPQWVATWPLVPRSRTLERPTHSSPSDLFQPYMYLMEMYHKPYTHATSLRVLAAAAAAARPAPPPRQARPPVLFYSCKRHTAPFHPY